MPAVDDAIALACNLAPDYYAKNMSPYALLQASGYCDHREAIDIEKIRSYVAKHPGLVGRWIFYSEDKRVDRGWYFSADTASGPFVVGYFPSHPKRPDKLFADGIEACAIFIKHELESIAS